MKKLLRYKLNYEDFTAKRFQLPKGNHSLHALKTGV
jgi:hypothetical protein